MRTKPNIVVLSLSSDLDVTTVPAVRREVESLLKQGCLRIILNMADVSYVDSAGMSFIMCVLRRIRAMGGLMSLTNVSQPVFRGLSRMRLVDFMPVARIGAREHIAPSDPPERLSAKAVAKELDKRCKKEGKYESRRIFSSVIAD